MKFKQKYIEYKVALARMVIATDSYSYWQTNTLPVFYSAGLV